VLDNSTYKSFEENVADKELVGFFIQNY